MVAMFSNVAISQTISLSSADQAHLNRLDSVSQSYAALDLNEQSLKDYQNLLKSEVDNKAVDLAEVLLPSVFLPKKDFNSKSLYLLKKEQENFVFLLQLATIAYLYEDDAENLFKGKNPGGIKITRKNKKYELQIKFYLEIIRKYALAYSQGLRTFDEFWEAYGRDIALNYAKDILDRVEEVMKAK